MEQEPGSSLFGMEVDDTIQQHLSSISKWGKFLAIFGIICLVFFLLGILVQGREIMDRINEMMHLVSDSIAGIIIAIIVIYFGLFSVWIFFLFRSTSLIKKGLVTQNATDLADAFNAMRNFFTISIVFSALSIIGTLYTLIKGF